MTTAPSSLPDARGLYDPAYEHDACGMGFIAHMKGKRSHAIVADALEMLSRMDHRGACGCEDNTGDGAGITTAMPHTLLRRVAQAEAGIELPEPGAYGCGNVFFPQDEATRERCRALVAGAAEAEGVELLGWRKLPTDAAGAGIGPSALRTEPAMEQLFVRRPASLDADERGDAFDRSLFRLRSRVVRSVREACEAGGSEMVDGHLFYVCSLSSRTLVYKGQLLSTQVPAYFPDLRDEDYQSHLAMVHSRFSTNTFPSWDRAQPCRWMCHNGEINTVRGNRNWMEARQGLLHSELLGDMDDLFPIINPANSDSGTFDNVLELLMMAGRSLPEAMMMMIPEAWEHHESMGLKKRAFYEYHANLIEPWDGPASVGFSDGRTIGATLDRNGLRPSRYYVTDDDRVILASEVGVVDVAPETIVRKGRLQPGRMLLVDFEQGRIIPDEELKRGIAEKRPYAQWLREQKIRLDDLPEALPERAPDGEERLRLLQAFGYTTEHVYQLLLPMVSAGKNSKEALGSMGNDAALAVLSDQPRLLYDYFKQLFAQVTNPPIDPLRETLIMALDALVGPEGNLLDTTAAQCHRLHLAQPVLTDAEMASIKKLDGRPGSRGWTSTTLDVTFDRPDPQDEEAMRPDRRETAVRAGAGNAGEPGDLRAAGDPLRAALQRLCDEADAAIAAGSRVLVLSDRGVSADRVAIPSLLAVGAVHHHLVRTHSRTRIGLVLESGEAREVHHFATLFGYGVDAVNPYLAVQAIRGLREEGVLDETLTDEKIERLLAKSIGLGLQKVMSKMGISTLASYHGAQIFEAVGLGQETIDRAFVGTASRISGAGLDVIAAESLRRHAIGFPRRELVRLAQLPNPGEYAWRPGGERHGWSPQVVASLQAASRSNSRVAYDQYARFCNDDAKHQGSLRGLLEMRYADEPKPKTHGDLQDGPFDGDGEAFTEALTAPGVPGQARLTPEEIEARPDPHAVVERELDGLPTVAISIDEVEPAKEIVKRFRTGAMSLGALSKEAHETLALAMNRVGGLSNSGEGGEDPKRFSLAQYPDGSVKSKRSAIKQIASGRFGVTSHYLANADRLQIKIAQGAKPGEGGQLPGFKVDPYIAGIRHSTPGVGLISPPPHHDIYSIEDLAQLIHDLKRSNPVADVSVKLVAEVGVGTVAAGVAKAKADHILISGADGGTGASPLTSIKHAGLPWELGLAEAHQTLVLNGLRSRVSLETDGGFKTGRDVVIAACLGAEEFGFSTAPMITMGCIMMRKCHLNTCPVGVCTQDPDLRAKFNGTPEHVLNYLFLVAEEARGYMAKMGVRTIEELVGRVELLRTRAAVDAWKAHGLDLSALLLPAKGPRADAKAFKCEGQDHGVEGHIDNRLIAEAMPALEHQTPVSIELPVTNLNRTVGTMLSWEVSKRHGAGGLPPHTIDVRLRGSAGQSLGAWLTRGVSITVTGDANDYVGKGLSGGRIVVKPPAASGFKAEDNILIGNVALYGATSGEAYFRGVAAERFCVRNSGALAVVEGVGDHGCEYMTGGRAVILGGVGRNFAAGMSGGIAYVLDRDDTLLQHCNLGMVELERIDGPDALGDAEELQHLIVEHARLTGSAVADKVLQNWEKSVKLFKKVMPIDYRRVLERQKRATAVENQPGALELGLG
ncbi:glutamate synthase-related protein [Phycisphaera mikurensis]|uniref:Glutamate synthase large subunit n=1 Tax=Phycisphaera mikurensis (strain NBRC 102666 / KCTC 22515 / FYK2301M01) TaxID=1142394 RepID=I0IHP2_PHYMF|nr:glutamate synthase-related protein [Phycisphaera mikurensis]MBB6441025.1 glutamate synthase (NADPH/NADH) large chain [Phycisphaera mikurensis]BAM04780.1 glutamate synthase large subunit [Phycisphaera mikurensis NBRC 102666]